MNEATVAPHCICTQEDDAPYCGRPECDIYYCEDCGPEFDDPCPRHINTPYETG